jgi:hypothetical protein
MFQRDIIKTLNTCSPRVSVIVFRIYFNINSYEIYLKNIQIQQSMEIYPVGPELSPTEWQTHRHDEANSHASLNDGDTLYEMRRYANIIVYLHKP